MPDSKRRVPKHTGPTPPKEHELTGAINLDQVRVQMMGELYQEAINQKNALQQHVQTLTGVVTGLLIQANPLPVNITKATVEKIQNFGGISVEEDGDGGFNISLVMHAITDEEE